MTSDCLVAVLSGFFTAELLLFVIVTESFVGLGLGL